MDNKKHYEEFDWENVVSEPIKKKAEMLAELIPEDVYSIVDVGCGNGIITNILNKKYIVVGVDRNQFGLKYVESETAVASADELPFSEDQFDLYLSSEMLEHLPQNILSKAVLEACRVSKKYILITVPNKENLLKNTIRCKNCQTIYNRSYHIHRFDDSKISQLFSNYTVTKSFSTGPKYRPYNKSLQKLKHKITKAESWLPFFSSNRDVNSMCPNCEYKNKWNYKFSFFGFCLDALNLIISPKRKQWLVVLLEKKQ